MGQRPLLDEGTAVWAARLTLPAGTSDDPRRAASLRKDVARDMPDVDAAARTWTRLGTDLEPTQVRVVGRLGWVRANLAALRGAFDPLAERMSSRPAASAKVLGAQIGVLFGLLSRKVLGQYILPLGGPGVGQLVVVGPNLLHLAAEHGPLAADIRRTILVHEITHRLQFDAVPWLGDHLRGLLRRYLEHARVDVSGLRDAMARLPAAVAEAAETGELTPVLRSLLTPEQADVIEEAQGLMSLLEGHGSAAMYAGSETVVARPGAVREAIQRRRGDVTSKLLNAIAGLEMKKRQYREGEAFVRAVVEADGVGGLNRAFDRPENLPTVQEIREPASWMQRMEA